MAIRSSRFREPGRARCGKDPLIHGSTLPGCRLDGASILAAMDRAQLADFLRTRREALQPEDVGLPRGARRRTGGLRREEVAALSGMSTDYYGRLEQRRGPQPSEQMLAAIARGLRLSLDERDHLFRIAGHNAPQRALRSDHVNPGLMRVLDRLDDTPAQVITGLAETLLQTRPAVALLGDQTRFTRAGSQHDLPLVHRPGRAFDLSRRGSPAAQPAVHRRPARRLLAGGRRIPGGRAWSMRCWPRARSSDAVERARGRAGAARAQADPAPRGRRARVALPGAAGPGPVAGAAGVHRGPRLARATRSCSCSP